MARILFSPVGGSDPIRNNRDGSMLHICRNYRPDTVYLYLSKEMYAHHVQDNRYLYCIEELGKKIGHSFDVHFIIREKLSEVQNHEVFYDDFREILQKIRNDMGPEDTLLVNIASGTPAMKNALIVLSVLGEVDFKAIQVTTPLKGINRTDENVYPFEADQEWEADDDNYIQEDRCTEVLSNNLVVLIRKNIIRQLLARYDYSASCLVAEEIKTRIDEKAFWALKQAEARLQLDYKRVAELAKRTGFNPVPIKKSEDRELVEYILALQIKEERGAYDDFVRSLSPAISELFLRVLNIQCHIDIGNYTRTDRTGAVRWDMNKLNGTELYQVLIEESGARFEGRGPVYTAHLIGIINHYSNNSRLNTVCNDLRLTEEKVRNLAAHQIISITQDMIHKETKFGTDEIIQKIRQLAEDIHLIADQNIWNSYSDMNNRIEMLL